MHKYVIMGVQGCGKGTQAGLLEKALDLVHISVGDIFRWHIKNHTKLGAQVKRIVASGNLVGDEIVEGIVSRRLEEHDWNYGFILDGFPRSISQAEFFLESYDIDAVIHIQVPDEVVRERVLARRLCSGCGLDYNLISHRPKQQDVCDVCGRKLVPRPDDTAEALADRLREYHTKTEPVLDLFRRKELVLDIAGTPPPDQIQSEIRGRLGV
jgi:adenylate kinase